MTKFLLLSLLFLPGSGCLTNLQAQGVVTLVGIVRGDDTPGLVPVDWTVDITPVLRPGDISRPSIVSKREIFVYMITRDWDVVDLVFSKPGYASVMVPVPLDGLESSHRVDADVILRKWMALSGPAPGDVTMELEQQAEIARRAGPKAVEAFQYNLQLYDRAYERDAGVTREIDTFRSNPRFREITRPNDASDVRLHEEVAAWNLGEAPMLSPREALQAAGDPSHTLTLRADAIRILPALDLTPADLLEAKRQLHALITENGAPELAASALEVLARIGDRMDVETVIGATRSTDPQVAQAAVEAIAGAPASEDLEILTELSQTHTDPRVRAAAIQGLEEREVGESVDELIVTVREDPSPLVRREAVEALGAMEIPAELRGEVDAILLSAETDISQEVRSEAQRVRLMPR